MKKMVFLSLAVLSFVSLESCKKGEESKLESKESNSNYKQNFNVQILTSSSKKDDFALYYTEDNTDDFKGENALWTGVKGGNLEETISFDFTEERIPTHIRLDFGMNPEQDSVVVYNVKVNYYENNFSFNGADFFKYFIDDKQFDTKVNLVNGTMTVYKKAGAYITPYFYPTQITVDNIKKIITEKN